MKSTQQRRQEIKARRLRRAERRARRATARPVDRPVGTEPGAGGVMLSASTPEAVPDR